MGVLTLGEVIALHFLLPWTWLKVALAVLSIYAVILIAGLIRERTHHPHELTPDRLTLKWGPQRVAHIDRADIGRCVRRLAAEHTYTALTDDLLVITPKAETNVELTLNRPVDVTLTKPYSTKKRSERVSRILLFTDDPDGFVQAVATQ
jgi:hypothetical protein